MAPSKRQVRIAWVVVLVVALGVQAALNNLSYLSTAYAFTALLSIVYGLAMIRFWRVQHPHGHAAEGKNNEPQHILPKNDNNEAHHEVELPGPGTKTCAEEAPNIIEQQGPPIIPNLEQQQQQPQRRLFFLDNVKIFLTLLVVTHHVECAFGGCGGGYYLVVGDYSNAFLTVIRCLNMLDQAFFMPLFFLISAYFTPTSYDRKKGDHQFLFSKAKRIWIPAMVAFFTIIPFTRMIGAAFSNAPILYIPSPDHCWFLLWLLLYNWVYTTVRQAESEEELPPPPRPFPTQTQRMLYGVLVCGVLMLGIYMLVEPFFFSMPIAIGSLANSTLFFGVGVAACRNGWFLSKIPDQLDLSIRVLRFLVVLEAGGLVVLFIFLGDDEEEMTVAQYILGVLFFLVAGVFCVDVSLVVLEWFQTHADVQTKTSRCLAQAAYTVYLIHPLVIVPVTGIFVTVYNGFYDDAIIQFEDDNHVSESQLQGPGDGSLHLFLGWLFVWVLTNLVVWPLAWWIRRLPGFKEVL